MIATLSALLCGAPAPGPGDALEQGFENPPHSARPRTWSHWTVSNITKEGITRDFEERRVLPASTGTMAGVGRAPQNPAESGLMGPVTLVSQEAANAPAAVVAGIPVNYDEALVGWYSLFPTPATRATAIARVAPLCQDSLQPTRHRRPSQNLKLLRILQSAFNFPVSDFDNL